MTYQTSSTHLDDTVLHFLDLSRDIVSLVHHENAILLESGEMNFEAYVNRKMQLMSSFEKQARNLLGLLSGNENMKNIQAILTEEIRRVRDALRINSRYQLELIRQRAHESMAADLASTKTKEMLCH